MRYESPELRDRLASEYVLGTLKGRARRRFERLVAERRIPVALVEQWEMRLNSLAESLPPEAPPARVWRAIEREIVGERTAPSATGQRFGLRAIWENLGFWRGFGLAAAAVAATLFLYIGVRPVTSPRPLAPLAALADKDGHVGFVVAAEPDSHRLVLRVAAVIPQVPSRSYELWLLPKGGAKPHSLGLISVAAPSVLTLSPALAAALPAAAGLAVSLEPQGGSPTGLPTGPVLFQGAVLAAR